MAEEVKQEEKKQEAGKLMSTLFKVVLAIVFLVFAGYLLISRKWYLYTWLMIKGSAGPCLILAGIITLAIAKE